MIYEIRTYTIKVGKVNEYVKHFEQVGLPIISKYSRLVGYWLTETGKLNQIIHIWEYTDFDDRTQKRAALYEDKDWNEHFIKKAMEMIIEQESRIMRATSFSPIR